MPAVFMMRRGRYRDYENRARMFANCQGDWEDRARARGASGGTDPERGPWMRLEQALRGIPVGVGPRLFRKSLARDRARKTAKERSVLCRNCAEC